VGIAKTAYNPLELYQKPKESEQPTKSIMTMGENDFPLPKRFYDYFDVAWKEDVEFDKDKKDQLNTIWNYAKTRIEKPYLSSLIVYVDRIARKLGYGGRADEKMYSKIYNYIKLSENIKEMEKERKIYEKPR
jgi:hypothetical protein